MRRGNTYRGLLYLATMIAVGAAGVSGQAVGAKPAAVPPGQEIEVLDPRVDPTGKPAVVLRELDGQICVDIPPTVLVHRYYYTGDRSFQAQLLPGGPTMVVVSHPKTGQRCYIEVQMPPGAPKVTYCGHAIEYDFGRQGVTILFLPACRPRVVYRNGTTVARAAARVTVAAKNCTTRVARESGLCEHAASLASGTKAAMGNVAHGAQDLAKQAVAPVQGLLQMTPLGSVLQSDPAAQAQWRRDQAVRKAQKQAARAEASIPTVR